ncbi:hypothetical protein DKX38_015062 [Salix brachista]|uniref:Protein kinase domain-containing protein n=1 Tax=Salix brachista TaxID=2182728 RepID=A0A5N5L468_9ROSI|nr:hypothetical protein DKX38_015062 [Salix brachista]
MHRSFLILLSFLCFFVNLCLSDPRATQAALICTNRTAKVPERQTFVANFLATLDAVTPLIMRQKYAAVINGTGSTTVYAFGECMKDLDGTDCNLCFAQCKTQVLRCLPFQRAIRGGRLFYDGCYLRYDDYDFFNETLSAQDKTICATGDFSGGNKTVFSANVLDLVKNLSVQAPKNDGFFVGSVDRGNVSVFGLAQCWEFVNGSACETCLTNAASKIGICAPKDEGRVLNAGCYLRYSTQKFYDNSTTPSRRNKRHGRLTVILAVTLPSVAVASIVATAVFFARRRVVEKKRARKELGALLVTVNKSKLNFSYESLEKATNYFHPSNKLGQGGSGSVYKGTLSDGTTVAIKRLLFNTRQWVDHFFNEVNLISGIQHKNLAKLLGCSVTGPESLLVYEYVPNQSLHDYFSGSKTNLPPLSWEMRGYMAPEYVVRGKLTEKVDVYSFGVLLIEVVSGKGKNPVPRDSRSLLQMVWSLHGNGRLCEAVDPVLEGDFQEDEASRLLHIGLLCVQASPELRPSMSKVVKMIKDSQEIPQPTQPPFLSPAIMEINTVRQPGSSCKSQPESSSHSSGNSMTQSWIEPR